MNTHRSFRTLEEEAELAALSRVVGKLVSLHYARYQQIPTRKFFNTLCLVPKGILVLFLVGLIYLPHATAPTLLGLFFLAYFILALMWLRLVSLEFDATHQAVRQVQTNQPRQLRRLRDLMLMEAAERVK